MATDPSPHLRIEQRPGEAGAGIVLAVSGELDPLSGPTLAAHVAEAVAAAPPVEGGAAVVLDLAEVAFVDSSGLRTLVDVHTGLQRRGARLVLRRPSRAILRLLEITSLDIVFVIEEGPAGSPA